MRYFVYIYVLIAVGLPALCFGEQPIDVLQLRIEEGLNILRDPRYRDPSQKDVQEEKLWNVTQKIFDFEEFSRRVLASYWNKFTPRQQKDFTTAFAAFLGKFYLRRLQAQYNGESILFIDQKLVGKNRAWVEINVLWKNVEVPVTIRMILRKGIWKVYDLSALGISAVGNYRAQLHWMLKKQSPDQVIETLKAKSRQI